MITLTTLKRLDWGKVVFSVLCLAADGVIVWGMWSAHNEMAYDPWGIPVMIILGLAMLAGVVWIWVPEKKHRRKSDG